jgi:hypothetical protein
MPMVFKGAVGPEFAEEAGESGASGRRHIHLQLLGKVGEDAGMLVAGGPDVGGELVELGLGMAEV